MFIQFDITFQQSVGSNDQVDRFQLGQCGLPFPLLPGHHQRAQRRCKFRGFLLPVVNERSRRHYQRRPPLLPHRHQVGQHLQRFPQAHIVSQYPAHSMPGQRFQPFEACLLIVAQRGMNVSRQFIFGILRFAQLLQHAPDSAAALHDQRFIHPGQVVQRQRPVFGQTDHGLFQIGRRQSQLFDQLGRRRELWLVQSQKSAVAQAMIAFFQPIGRQQFL